MTSIPLRGGSWPSTWGSGPDPTRPPVGPRAPLLPAAAVIHSKQPPLVWLMHLEGEWARLVLLPGSCVVSLGGSRVTERVPGETSLSWAQGEGLWAPPAVGEGPRVCRHVYGHPEALCLPPLLLSTTCSPETPPARPTAPVLPTALGPWLAPPPVSSFVPPPVCHQAPQPPVPVTAAPRVGPQ